MQTAHTEESVREHGAGTINLSFRSTLRAEKSLFIAHSHLEGFLTSFGMTHHDFFREIRRGKFVLDIFEGCFRGHFN